MPVVNDQASTSFPPTSTSPPQVENDRDRKRRGRVAAQLLSLRYRVLGLTVFILGWYALAAALNSRFFPFPHEVLLSFRDIIGSGIFFENLFITVLRVTFGFGIAFVISLFVGMAMGVDRRIEASLEAFVLIGLTIPSLVWSLLAVMWFGISELSAIFAVVVIMSPYLVSNVWGGTRALDSKVTQMAKTFGANKTQTVRHIVIPHLGPFLFAGSRIGFSLAWKAVVIVELLGQSNGVGYQLNRSYNLFAIDEVLAWTFGFMLVMGSIEFGVFRPMERYATRWKL